METILVVLQVIGLVALSGIYSGLNIALMSLSKSDLIRKKKLDSLDAMRVLPFRLSIATCRLRQFYLQMSRWFQPMH